MIKKFDLQKIELEVIEWFINEYPDILDSLENQLQKVQNIERKFTGVGVFVCFSYLDIDIYDFKKNCNNKILDGLSIKSSELKHICSISLHLKDDCMIDYIEFEFGFLEKKYPENYSLISFL